MMQYSVLDYFGTWFDDHVQPMPASASAESQQMGCSQQEVTAPVPIFGTTAATVASSSTFAALEMGAAEVAPSESKSSIDAPTAAPEVEHSISPTPRSHELPIQTLA